MKHLKNECPVTICLFCVAKKMIGIIIFFNLNFYETNVPITKRIRFIIVLKVDFPHGKNMKIRGSDNDCFWNC